MIGTAQESIPGPAAGKMDSVSSILEQFKLKIQDSRRESAIGQAWVTCPFLSSTGCWCGDGRKFWQEESGVSIVGGQALRSTLLQGLPTRNGRR